MKNYTEQLKKYWLSKDLTFIATLNKINSNQGFFNHFINPASKMRLFYPVFDEIELEDKRVSFFYPNSKKLNHGDYYKVSLAFTDNPNGKNNPYSLGITNVSSLNQEKIKNLLEESITSTDHDTVIYFGRYRKVNDTFCAFENVMNSDSGEILMRNGESQQVFVSPKLPLQDNTFYSFSIRENQGKLPNALPNTVEELNINPYEDYIRLRFERLNNPEANKMIANLMREIGKGMYSSKQRMIFELLQNADDAPGKEKVEFHIDIIGDYFFVMHDGAPFNKDDVEAITSAAESTKRDNSKKTGYKGIGFKSVFTDSTEVWLKSGGYQFAFIRNNELFDDFDRFYFSSARYKKYPELLEEDKLKYRNQRLRFNGSTDIPWQVIPIWQEELPCEFNDSNFNNFNNPVQFALKLGESNIGEYKQAIDNITKRPQFLLFLRNTSKFRSPKNGVTVFRTDSEDGIEITKTKRDEPKLTFRYIKKVFENIEVSDEAFSSIGIGLKKESRINDYSEVTYFFTDLEGREIETIPPKLASATETEISIGISLIKGEISPEKEYLTGLPKYSSLFTYLPMEDTRFQLPFLVNADFVPSSDRQKIQGDNLWNKYIMIKVAEKHIQTLSFLADKFISNKESNKTYLSLLLKDLLPEDDTAQQIIHSYNEKYTEQVQNVQFVVNDLSEKQLISETIIDDSGLIKLFGHDLFYQIIHTEKRLPHPDLEVTYLKRYEYLDVEFVNLDKLAQHITPEICEKIGLFIANNSLYESEELMLWLDKLVVCMPDNFGKIPFIVHNNSLFSLERLVSEEDAWILNKHTKDYKALFDSLGYHTVDLQLEKFTEINGYLLSYDGYLNDKNQTYERIASNKTLPRLDMNEKIQLIDFMKDSKFMFGIGEKKYFEELEIFIDEKNNSRPLRHLIGRFELNETSSIKPFRMDETEYQLLPDRFKNELIEKQAVFTSFILNPELFDEWNTQFNSENLETYVSELSLFFGWKKPEAEIMQSQWASIPWLYSDEENKFIESNRVYWSPAFSVLTEDKYLTIKHLFHDSELKLLPVKCCGVLVKLFDLKTDSALVTDWEQLKSLDTISANILLDWLQDDGDYNDFFENYNFIPAENETWNVVEIENARVFDGSDLPLKSYIYSEEDLKERFKALDKALCSNGRYKAGLLQGDKLIDAIIDSKLFTQSLASLLPQDLNWNRLEAFVKNLSEFKLFTGTDYNSTSPEHVILSLILKHVGDSDPISNEIQEIVDCLRGKITINNQPMSDFDLGDIIQFGKGEEKKELNLSDVLEEFKGESDVLDSIRESFTSISQKSKLRKLVFRTRWMAKEEICQRIEEEESLYYSVHQVVFQILFSTHNGNRQWSKKHFDDFWINKNNKVALEDDYRKFLDIIFAQNITKLNDFDFVGFELKNCLDDKFALPSEVLPNWLQEWTNKDPKRYEFLVDIGYNGVNSSIVKLRQSAISKEFDQNQVIRFFQEAKSNYEVLINTIEWLSKFSSEIISRNILLIEQINNLPINAESKQSIFIPLILAIDKEEKRQYTIKLIDRESDIFKIGSEEQYSYSIFNALKNDDSEVIIIDSSIGNLGSYFNLIEIELNECVDYELLERCSELWDEAFYKKWEYYSEYPIYIYQGGEIPYLRQFGNKTINQFTNDLKVESNGKFFVSKIIKNDILDNLPEGFPENALNNLKNWHYKTLQNESLLDEDSFEYKENIDRLLQDRLGISEEDQKKESGNAKTHAVYFLDDEGFDVSQVAYSGAYLTGIRDNNGNYIDCIVRSAKGGLLYLDKHHWDMLENDSTYLVVIYPGNAPRLFKDRIELLAEELAENVLFKIPNSKRVDEVNGVFEALESESHLILVTSEKMKESLFSKLKQDNQFSKEGDTAVKGDDFKF